MVMKRMIIGAIHQHLDTEMVCYFSDVLKMNTVHVEDVTRALWFLSTHGESGSVYNLADSGDTTQGRLCEITSGLFGVKHSYLGWMKTMAMKKMEKKLKSGYLSFYFFRGTLAWIPPHPSALLLFCSTALLLFCSLLSAPLFSPLSPLSSSFFQARMGDGTTHSYKRGLRW
jgi:hypothetical protein